MQIPKNLVKSSDRTWYKCITIVSEYLFLYESLHTLNMFSSDLFYNKLGITRNKNSKLQYYYNTCSLCKYNTYTLQYKRLCNINNKKVDTFFYCHVKHIALLCALKRYIRWRLYLYMYTNLYADTCAFILCWENKFVQIASIWFHTNYLCIINLISLDVNMFTCIIPYKSTIAAGTDALWLGIVNINQGPYFLKHYL